MAQISLPKNSEVKKGKKVEIKYRDVHSKTLTNDVQYFPPQERVY